ncbi:MAG: endonuclease domain-containing protein [Gammaproteobacteria bacterium]
MLDFYCDARHVAIELDGGQHADDAVRDVRRDAFLSEHGIRVLRFWNDAVFKSMEDVLETVWFELQQELPSSAAARHLLPEGEGKADV